MPVPNLTRGREVSLTLTYEKSAYSLYANGQLVKTFSKTGFAKAKEFTNLVGSILQLVSVRSETTINLDNYINRRKYPSRKRPARRDDVEISLNI